MKAKSVLLLIGVLLIAVFAVAAEVNKGAADITLNGATMGNIAFPHQEHQTALNDDCMACHDMFAQEAGVIDKLKAEDKLKKKEVMNKKCLNCHRAKKNEGVKTGPTSCTECHKK